MQIRWNHSKNLDFAGEREFSSWLFLPLSWKSKVVRVVKSAFRESKCTIFIIPRGWKKKGDLLTTCYVTSQGHFGRGFISATLTTTDKICSSDYIVLVRLIASNQILPVEYPVDVLNINMFEDSILSLINGILSTWFYFYYIIVVYGKYPR